MILITGASGNVGREVVKQALAVGLKIRATFHSPAVAAQAPAGLEGVIMDYAKPETIRPALEGVEKIFLIGPRFGNCQHWKRISSGRCARLGRSTL